MTRTVLSFVARLLISAEFANAALGKAFGWSGQAAYMASHGLPMIPVLLAAALVIEAVGVVCLITGFQARPAALVMAGYLAIVTVTLHDFWRASGNLAGLQQTEFLKNLGIIGGLLMIGAYGPARSFSAHPRLAGSSGADPSAAGGAWRETGRPR